MNTLNLTIQLLLKKYKNVDDLIKDVVRNEEHPIFVFGKDFAKEITAKSENWNWINENLIDDLNSIVVNNIQKFLVKNYIDVLFVTKNNNLTYFLSTNNTKGAIKWLIERYVNVLKNVFDKRSSKSLKISYFYIEDNLNLKLKFQ